MGGWFSRRITPTAADYEAYMKDLREVKEFFEGSFLNDPVTLEAARKWYKSLGDGYDKVLEMKKSQVSNTRRFATKRRQSKPSAAETELLEQLSRLFEVVEPMCESASEKYGQFMELVTSHGPGVVDDGVVGIQTNDDELNAGTNRQHCAPSAGVRTGRARTLRSTTGGASATAGSSQVSTSATADNDNDSDDDIADPLIQTWRRSTRESLPDEQRSRKTRWPIDRDPKEYLAKVFDKYKKEGNDNELKRKLSVKFQGEEGVDQGALTREFFYTTFETVITGHYKDCPMFEGERGHLIPCATAEHLVGGYLCLGMMIGHAVMNGCRGLPGLSPAVQHYILHVHGKGTANIEESAPPLSVEDVTDLQLRQILIKLQNKEKLSTDEDERVSDWLERCGSRAFQTEQTTDLILQTILIHYTYLMRIKQLDALAQGLEKMGLRQLLADGCSECQKSLVFPSPDDVVTTPERFLRVVKTIGGQPDQKARGFLERFVQELGNGNIPDKTIGDLVQFLSGSQYLPRQIVLMYSTTVGQQFPKAHCCLNELQVPTVHQDYDSFRQAMIHALQQPLEFTDA